MDELHPLAAPARDGLDDERIAELGAEPDDVLDRGHRIGRARDDRHPGRPHRLARDRLRPHQLDRLRRRADPDEARLLARAREACVLGEEAVTRVHRLGSGAARGGDELLRDQVALRRGLAAERERLVRVRGMARGAVGVRVHGDRADPQLAQRPEDPDRDLAPVGDQHLREKGHWRIFSIAVGLADQLTVARILAVPVVIVLFVWDFPEPRLLGDGRLRRRDGHRLVRRADRAPEREAPRPLGSLLDPIADKILVLSVLVVLVGEGAFPGWMVALIVAREFFVSGLRLAAIERGVTLEVRDLGKLKTWAQALAAGIGGFAAAGAWSDRVAWWALLVALVLTWVSGLDYARLAPGLLRGRAAV